MEKVFLEQSHQLLQNHFELDSLETTENNKEALWEMAVAQLSSEIAHLIDNDFERLLYILYRIDVDEKKVREALAKSEFDKGPKIIAEMILLRQMEKIKTREAYKKGKL
ncbi:MAG: hypothetical protein WD048_02650 [Chitinophagales bacterium]